MTSAQLTENIEDNLIRLKRHYDICVNGYDRAALKDLAHVLRNWMDMGAHVDHFLKINNPKIKFYSFGVEARFNRIFKNYEYSIICFPKGVFSYTLGDDSNMTQVHLDSHNRLFVSAFDTMYENEINGKKKHRITHLISVYSNKQLSEELLKHVHSGWLIYSKTTFSSWASSVSARIKRYDNNAQLIIYDISREAIVRRVANILGGSHPEGAMVMNDINDPIVKELLTTTMLFLPLPYLILLKIAQDILQAFE